MLLIISFLLLLLNVDVKQVPSLDVIVLMSYVTLKCEPTCFVVKVMTLSRAFKNNLLQNWICTCNNSLQQIAKILEGKIFHILKYFLAPVFWLHRFAIGEEIR